MKRIHYGTLQLDVSDEFASVFEEWVTSLVESRYWTSRSMVGSGIDALRGGHRAAFYAVPCYIPGNDFPTVVRILVGHGHDLAITPVTTQLPDPAGSTEAVLELRAILAEE